jgi:hypothetical protein
MIKHLCRAALLLTLLALSGCSDKKAERELYEEKSSGLTYSTYKTSSRVAVGAAVTLYNSQKPDSIPPLQSEYAHVLLGYFWTGSSRPAMAFAEADIVEESNDDELKFLAGSLRSIAMYQQGWSTLAKEESDKTNTLVARNPSTNIQYEATTFYMVLAILKAYEKDFEQSKFYWAGFANQTGIHWPYQLTDAAADLQAGKIQQGLGKIKVISQDPAVPEALRIALSQRITAIEKQTGDVSSPFFWPNLISTVVIEELKRSNQTQLAPIIKLLEGVKEKLS